MADPRSAGPFTPGTPHELAAWAGALSIFATAYVTFAHPALATASVLAAVGFTWRTSCRL